VFEFPIKIVQDTSSTNLNAPSATVRLVVHKNTVPVIHFETANSHIQTRIFQLIWLFN